MANNNTLDEIYERLLNSTNNSDNELTEEEILKQASELHSKLKEELSKEEELSRELGLLRNNALLKPSKEVLGYLSENKSSQDEYEPYLGYVNIDPITGIRRISPYKKQNNKKEVDLMELVNNDVNEVIDKQIIEESIGMTYEGVSDEDILEIYSFLKKFTKEDMENPDKKIFPHLPKLIKDGIDAEMEANAGVVPYMDIQFLKEQLAREFFITLSNDIAMDKEYIEIEEELANITNYNVMSIYLDNIFDVLEVQMVNTANINREEGNIETADNLIKFSEAFKRAYTIEKYYTKENNKSAKAIEKDTRKKLKSFDKICKKFNTFYSYSKFVITDCRILLPILDKNLPDDIHIDDIKKFIIFILGEFMKLDPNNIIDHVEMYYFIKIIECLEYTENDDTSQKKALVIGNIEEVIRRMNK